MAKYGFETKGNTIVADFPEQVKGKTFLITGPSKGGIGAETASSLALGSPEMIVLVGRSLEKIQPCIDDIHGVNPAVKVKFIEAQLDSLASIRSAAKRILDDPEIQKLDVIINNAAIMTCPYGTTVDGLELQFGTNYVSHFLLTNLLMPKILAAGHDARVVNVSSLGHWFMLDFNVDNIGFHGGKTYDPIRAYGMSKTANILMAVSLNEKLGVKGLHAFALHPGSIMSGLQKYLTPDITESAYKLLDSFGVERPDRKTLQQGSSTTLRAALDPSLVGKGKVYLDNCQLTDDPKVIRGYALDAKNAEALWKVSEELVGQKFEYQST